jgi:thiamine pyrophosphokinase
MLSVLIANGLIQSPELFKDILVKADYIISVDGGLKYLDALGVNPDLLLGDFDSAGEGILEKYASIEKRTFPKRKDATDSELAIEVAVQANPKELVLLGMTGKRLDHGLTNLHLLKKIPSSINAYVLDEHNKVYYCNGDFKTQGNIGDMLSIIPITREVSGIKTKGLEYPLNDETLYFDGSRGVSNVIKDSEIEIETKSGEFFIILSKD